MPTLKKEHLEHSLASRSECIEQASPRNPDYCPRSPSNESPFDARNPRPRRCASRQGRTCRVSDSYARTATAGSPRKPSLLVGNPNLPQYLPTDLGLSPPEQSHTRSPIQTQHEHTPVEDRDSATRQRNALSPPRRVKSESPPKGQPEMPWFAVSPSSTVAHAIAGGSPVQAPPCYPIDAADNAARASYEAISEHFRRFPARSREELGDRVALLSIVRRNQSSLLNQIIYPH